MNYHYQQQQQQFTSTWVRDVQFPATEQIFHKDIHTSTMSTFMTLDSPSRGATGTPAGFFQTLGVLIITLAISEVICLLLLQVVSRITWNSFYSEFSSFPLFILELAPLDEGIREQIPMIEKEQLDHILITTKWKNECACECECNEDRHDDDSSGGDNSIFSSRQCAICLCDYEENDSISKSKYCDHNFHTQCYKKWLLSCNRESLSCPYCRCRIG